MRREYLPYYLSRAALSALLALLVMGITWKAVIAAIALFGLFLLYLHSGWFHVDPSHRLTPVRRDERARQIQRKALIASAAVGMLLYGLLTLTADLLDLSLVSGPLALAIGAITYFITQFVLLSKA